MRAANLFISDGVLDNSVSPRMGKVKRVDIDLSRLLSRLLSRFRENTPIIFGGMICFLMAFFLLSGSPPIWLFIIYKLLQAVGAYGLLAFYKEVEPALILFMIAIVYLPSGFLGGLYTGYKTKENLKIVLLYPSLIGFAILLILQLYFGVLDLSSPNLGRDILVPLVGSIVGSYLGGYAVNWEKEEEL